MAAQNDQEILVYVGTYTRRGSEGIYVYRLNLSSGELTAVSKASGVENPSYLALHPDKRYLYAVNEVEEFKGQPGGAVSAFAIDAETGGLTFLNQQASHGAAPCHLSVDRTGRFVLVANYTGGNASVLPIEADGRLGEASHIVQHQGSSINPKRQAGPHAHSINLDPANRYAYVADLGLDKVMIYRLDLDQGKLIASDPPWAQVKAGAGPRHFTFHPNGRYAYVINEMGSSVTGFSYDETSGALHELQTVPTLPENFEGASTCADIHIHPSGRFLYGSNRGHDSIVIYALDEETGKLSYAGHEPTGGQTPRNFVIDPSGTFLLAANQNTDSIVTFRIDPQTGQLSAAGHTATVSMPVCLKMLQV